mmetsp:Transcript_13248/g.39498  ORF Transcript_13248/g.39498 Transcript_13248/m.39498 type:complete len:204 (+) Transcript_13248:676-1287(+)
MEALVQLAHHHDVADLAVLVGLGAVELAAVDHRDRLLHALLEAGEVAQVGQRRHHAAELLAVDGGGHGAEDDAAGLRGLLQVLQEEVGQQEVAEVVRREAQLVAIRRPARASAGDGELLVRVREVDRGVAHEAVQAPVEGAEALDEVAHAVVRREVAVHHLEAVLGEVHLPRDLLALGEVLAGHDHKPLAALDQGLGRVEAEA